MSDAADSAHVSAETLAELDAGLLPPAEGGNVRRHVATCTTCAASLTAVERVREALASVPAEPMPADVAARLDAAFAAEPPLRQDVVADSGSPAVAPPLAAPNVVPLRRRRVWPRGPAVASAAAVVVIFAAVAGVVISAVVSHQGKDTSTTASRPDGTSANGGIESQTVTTSTGHNYTSASLPTQVRSLVALDRSSDRTAVGSSGAAGGTAPKAAATPAPAGSALSGGAATPVHAVPAALSPLHDDPARLARCLAQLSTSATSQPLAVDFAQWDKAPAIVVVLAGVQRTVDVFVVGPGCGSAGADPVDLRYFRRLPAG